MYQKVKYQKVEELMDELTLIAQAMEINNKSSEGSGIIHANKTKMYQSMETGQLLHSENEKRKSGVMSVFKTTVKRDTSKIDCCSC